MLEEVLGGNPPKNGTSHWTSLLGMFFCTFSGQFRNFRCFCTSLVAGNYDMLEVVSCGTPLKMVLPSGRAYQECLSVHFLGSLSHFVCQTPHTDDDYDRLEQVSCKKPTEKWYFPLDAHTKNRVLYIFRAASEFLFFAQERRNRKL